MVQRGLHSAARMLCAIPLLAVIRRNSCGKQVADSAAGSGDVVKDGALCGSLFVSCQKLVHADVLFNRAQIRR